ncbi:MAG: cation-translocating P-type ATPase [Chitinophagaceae bacterium]|nr:cation-translocating P-type ATPase [Chitinophagaceae bacterium]
MQKIQWKVEGMDCNTCALSIYKYLEKQGAENIKVNYATGDVIFDVNHTVSPLHLSEGIRSLGYEVVTDGALEKKPGDKKKFRFLNTPLSRFLFCLPFTLLLMTHMIHSLHQYPFFHFLNRPVVQLLLSLPVYFTGMYFFGSSAWKSIRNGMPNMNVLIAVGATAAFVYSLYGTLTGQPEQYMFYETAATIFTLVFLGNYLEDASVASTQKAIHALVKTQKVMANMIAFDENHKEQIFQVDSSQLRTGDLILIRTGEQVPADCKILWGEVQVNESVITGESLPVFRKPKDILIGGSLITEGTVKAQVTAAGEQTVLSGILQMVRQAQGEKPPLQKLADKISAIFIPVVLGIAVLCFFINWMILDDFTAALMRSIAVLVIACPCAMGLATPAAIAVGLGRAARNGILFRNAANLEHFRQIKQVVFDKTGTLTTGRFSISRYQVVSHCADEKQDFTLSDDQFKKIVYSLEKYSNHPVAKSIVAAWKSKEEIRWKKVEEIKGLGVRAEDPDGNIWYAASYKAAETVTADKSHNVYVVRNDCLIGWLDVTDEIRPEAAGVIQYLHQKGIRTVLLSGDTRERTEALARKIGIQQIYAEQTPEQKWKIIKELNKQMPTAMVGDGINDAPALAEASLGIAMNDATQIALQSADVILMNQGLKKLPEALGLGIHTYRTVKQNLFWAFSYNIIAIPVAAMGFLTPTLGALIMGLSDVVLALNSVRLFVKKVT